MAMNKVLCAAALLVVGCKPYKLEPPPGFAEVSADEYGSRMIGGEHVGLNLKVWNNVPGGTLTFWSQDLVRKLADREYALTRQTAVESGNGVVGTRFEFDYVNPDGEAKFYSVVVFATNEHLFALQMAGNAEYRDRFRAELDQAIRDARLRGCRAWGGRPCRGPQPPTLQTPPLPDRGAAQAEGEEEGEEPEPEPKREAEPKPKAEPKAKAEPKDEAEPKAESKPKAEPKPKSEPKPKAEPKPKSEP
jgi:hypothetical protein